MKNHILYIIMRKDIPDMNPGKLGAQAAHAQALASRYFANTRYVEEGSAWAEWAAQADGFGTTIVLEAELEYMNSLCFSLGLNKKNFVVDPTYPYRNYFGDVYTSREITSMWYFSVENDPNREKLKSIRLHR
jgi:hypothetical protein